LEDSTEEPPNFITIMDGSEWTRGASRVLVQYRWNAADAAYPGI
jgi:hypothetical protein